MRWIRTIMSAILALAVGSLLTITITGCSKNEDQGQAEGYYEGPMKKPGGQNRPMGTQ